MGARVRHSPSTSRWPAGCGARSGHTRARKGLA
ncbi:unnamed protein product [Spirodela intermedia]|uniref:Uncharacterized protein n=1 Tax=Spirodela intermedia TaxID=51605 RepID=A0A7I8JS44_SPIIN|nr:unnamed protein product [Spirodela intermedia]CAA6672944.1 unnamed protein product [Spirodela intermedia]